MNYKWLVKIVIKNGNSNSKLKLRKLLIVNIVKIGYKNKNLYWVLQLKSPN
jgi:hypothetical protein